MLWFKKKIKNEIPQSGPVIFHSPCDIDDDVYLVEYNKTLVGINIDCCIKHLKVSSLRFENEGVEWNKRRVLNIVCTEVPGGKSFWFTHLRILAPNFSILKKKPKIN